MSQTDTNHVTDGYARVSVCDTFSEGIEKESDAAPTTTVGRGQDRLGGRPAPYP